MMSLGAQKKDRKYIERVDKTHLIRRKLKDQSQYHRNSLLATLAYYHQNPGRFGYGISASRWAKIIGLNCTYFAIWESGYLLCPIRISLILKRSLLGKFTFKLMGNKFRQLQHTIYRSNIFNIYLHNKLLKYCLHIIDETYLNSLKSQIYNHRKASQPLFC